MTNFSLFFVFVNKSQIKSLWFNSCNTSLQGKPALLNNSFQLQQHSSS